MRSKNLNSAWILLLPFIVCFSLVCGFLLPENPYVFIQEQLELNCTTELSNLSSSNFSFTKGDYRISPDHVTVISNTTAMLNLTIDGVDGAGRYDCWDGSHLIGTQIVKVEYALREVENLTCVVYDWTEGMKCTWNLAVNYVRPDDILVELYYTTNMKTYKMCPEITNTSCTWDTMNFSGASFYFIVVRITNKVKRKEEVKQTILQVTTLDSVKPSPVYSIKSSSNETCAFLNWKHQNYRPKIYRVQHMTRNKTLVSANFTSRENAEIEICDLHPYTLYQFTIDCKPDYNGYWSDAEVIIVRTQPDVPLSGPQVASGSFELFSCNGMNERSVNIFWGDVLEEEQRGEIEGYLLVHNNSSLRLNGNLHSHQMTNLKCAAEHVIHIYSENTVGYSVNYSTIIIPHLRAKKPSVLNFTVELETREDKSFTVARWMPSLRNATYTVFWCLMEEDESCEVGIDWIHTSANADEVELPLTKHNWLSMKYGVAVDKHGRSGGIQWTRCRIKKDAKLTEPPKSVQVYEKVGALEVQWIYEQCPQDSQAFTQFYIINICKEPASCEEYKIDGSRKDYLYRDPSPRVNYIIYIIPHTSSGPGPQSSTVYHKVVPDDESLKITLIAATSAVLIVAVICICCYCKCKKDTSTEISNLEASKYSMDFRYIQNLPSPSHQDLIDPQILDSPVHENLTATELLQDSEKIELVTTEYYHCENEEGGKVEKDFEISISTNPTTKVQYVDRDNVSETCRVPTPSREIKNIAMVNADYVPFQETPASSKEIQACRGVGKSSSRSDKADKSNKNRISNGHCLNSDYIDNTLRNVSNIPPQDHVTKQPYQDSRLENFVPTEKEIASRKPDAQWTDANEQTPTLHKPDDIKPDESHNELSSLTKQSEVAIQDNIGYVPLDLLAPKATETNVVPPDKLEAMNSSDLLQANTRRTDFSAELPDQITHFDHKQFSDILPPRNGYLEFSGVLQKLHSKEGGFEKADNSISRELHEKPSVYISGVTTDEISDDISVENSALPANNGQMSYENRHIDNRGNKNATKPCPISDGRKNSADTSSEEKDSCALSHANSSQSSSGSLDSHNLSQDSFSYVKVEPCGSYSSEDVAYKKVSEANVKSEFPSGKTSPSVAIDISAMKDIPQSKHLT